MNGSGAKLIPNLLEVMYATAAGFIFVMMYCKTKSLLLCIAAHGVFNAFSGYALYIALLEKRESEDSFIKAF